MCRSLVPPKIKCSARKTFYSAFAKGCRDKVFVGKVCAGAEGSLKCLFGIPHIVNLIRQFLPFRLIINLICNRKTSERKCSRLAVHTIKIDKKQKLRTICKALSAVLGRFTFPATPECVFRFKESFTFRIIANFILCR